MDEIDKPIIKDSIGRELKRDSKFDDLEIEITLTDPKQKTKEVTKDLEWKNISHETYRVYVFPDGKEVRINKPVLINISKSGGARILDAFNVSHYIPFKWIHLYWETNDNNAFRF